jgi:hypothetical protein
MRQQASSRRRAADHLCHCRTYFNAFAAGSHVQAKVIPFRIDRLHGWNDTTRAEHAQAARQATLNMALTKAPGLAARR